MQAVVETLVAKPLCAPWRLEHIVQADDRESYAFCTEATGSLAGSESLGVRTGDTAIAALSVSPEHLLETRDRARDGWPSG